LALAAIAIIPAANDLERFELRSRLNQMLYDYISDRRIQVGREMFYKADFDSLARTHPKEGCFKYPNDCLCH